MKERVAEAKRTMEKCIADHKLLTQTIEQQYREKEAKLQAGLRKQMEQLITEQTSEINEL
jgi:hypothetical protein